MKYIFDLDDMSDKNNVLPRLKELKKDYLPNLKVTLFTIPHDTSKELLQELADCKDWISVVRHGQKHDSNFEFAKLSKEEAMKKFWDIPHFDYYDKGFKAPGWQISQGTMEALKELNWWVAVQWSDGQFEGHPDGPFQPKVIEGLKYYALNELPPKSYIAIHGHTWNCCGNGLEEIWPALIKLPRESQFELINDYVRET